MVKLKKYALGTILMLIILLRLECRQDNAARVLAGGPPAAGAALPAEPLKHFAQQKKVIPHPVEAFGAIFYLLGYLVLLLMTLATALKYRRKYAEGKLDREHAIECAAHLCAYLLLMLAATCHLVPAVIA